SRHSLFLLSLTPFPSSTTLSCCLHPTLCLFYTSRSHLNRHSFPTRRSSDLTEATSPAITATAITPRTSSHGHVTCTGPVEVLGRSEEHTSELQSRFDLVCRLLLEKKK